MPASRAAHAQGRCGYGPRLPLLVISPYAKQNYVDHTVTDQTSIIRFIEDNWLGGQRISGSFDAIAGTINGMFDFKNPSNRGEYLLDPSTGLVTTDNVAATAARLALVISASFTLGSGRALLPFSFGDPSLITRRTFVTARSLAAAGLALHPRLNADARLPHSILRSSNPS